VAAAIAIEYQDHEPASDQQRKERAQTKSNPPMNGQKLTWRTLKRFMDRLSLLGSALEPQRWMHDGLLGWWPSMSIWGFYVA
jgi:hypothetical protein